MNDCPCGRGPTVAVLAVVGPNGWWQGPEVCEQCEDEHFDRLKEEYERKSQARRDA